VSDPVEEDLLAAAQRVLPDVIEIRRRIHRQPEIGLQLPNTQAVVIEELERLGLEPRLGESTSSVTALIEGGRPGPTILLRGDMDALPLQEISDLDFASEIPGAMHACGHDTHVAMLLGAARLLVERRSDLQGRVLLMFQPGEEGYAGARFMLEEGLMDVPEMASADVLIIRVRGRGGHASAPHLAVDPIVVAAEIIVALQTMVTRNIDPFDPAVLTIANVIAGTTNNIIPETAFMKGTIRAVSEKTRATVAALARRVAEGIASAHGASAEVEIEPGYPVTINDPAFAAFVSTVAEDLLGAEAVTPLPAPIMGAEDFSYVLQRMPGAMAFLGARLPGLDAETAPQNHSDRVVFDEDALPVGMALYAAVVLRHLEEGEQQPG
jgi:metal-dependent amidase/aminoacylase/carboxypeptidase family protein